MSETAPQVEGRSARKRRVILEAARSLFLQGGYKGTSMDEVAAKAAVSKQTVYKHFADKERLFAEIITDAVGQAERTSDDLLDALAETDDVATDLRRFAREHVTTVLQPHLVRMRRIIIAEAERFPDLARHWYETGPDRGHQTLADLFRGLERRGLLRLDDPSLAAQHFNWLILSIPLNQAMFGVGEPFTTTDLHHYADEGVRVFLAAYATD